MILKLRNFKDDENAGLYGIIVFASVIGGAAVLYLLFNTFLEFFFNFMRESPTKDFLVMLWVHGGILVLILFASIFSLLVYMQKSKYQQYGGPPQ